MTGLSRETRLQIMLGEAELAAIDDWRFKQRMPSRAAAIRELLRLALSLLPGDTADPSRRSRDFGLLNSGERAKADHSDAPKPKGRGGSVKD
ncbi:MAG: hypothetical protein JSS20_16560 [Proteobacteria bacterium]|nr:hypothetical protein [Pseudomonadota bacterium]